jgi:pimeloyl-ACP methyl ester carboxylesterase
VLRETVAPLVARAAATMMIKKMFRPRSVPKRFWREFPLALAYRPSQLRASQEETTMMAPAASRLSRYYAAMDLPVSILVGGDDAIADPMTHSIALHRAIRHSDLQVIPGVGHMVHYAAPETVADAVRAATDQTTPVPADGLETAENVDHA